MDEHLGAVLVETYRIDRLIGEGGMGRVYEATHLRLPKRFAVKMLNVSMLGNLEALLRFRREAEIVATLEHPNIVTLFDYNLTDDGVPYVVLEYLDGEHLGKRIARGKLGVSGAMRILVPVAQALHFAHTREIVHRDLKPENILLLKSDSVKVVDFGIAKIRGGMELTGVNTILGTVPYMAPEQLMGGPIDARTDQFALASITYEMLTGEMAFGATNVPAAAARVAHHHPPQIEGVPEAVNRALTRAFSKKADERFPSVDAFLKEIIAAASERGAVVPEVAVDDDGLPELPGEATSITRPTPAPTMASGDEDPDDQVAEPPWRWRKSQITDKTPPPMLTGEDDRKAARVIVDDPDSTIDQPSPVSGWAMGPGTAAREGLPTPDLDWDDATAQVEAVAPAQREDPMFQIARAQAPGAQSQAQPQPRPQAQPQPQQVVVAGEGGLFRPEPTAITARPQAQPQPQPQPYVPPQAPSSGSAATVLHPIISDPPPPGFDPDLEEPGSLTGVSLGRAVLILLIVAVLAGGGAAIWIFSHR
ncbi:MAG: serine/threonine protein kinase [Myxococcales bacterium]|nr:serine/threonine protein kinase [Myxococcales bacterium]